jgi:hypothetical protein
MKRMKVMFGQRRIMILATLAILVLAAAALAASSANFTAQSANAGNVFTTGALEMSNDQPASAWLSTSLMVPGQSKEGTVTIGNTGNVDGVFTLRVAKSDETKGFAGVLELRITGTDGTDWSGTLDQAVAASPISLSTIGGGDDVEYTIRATFPDQGADIDNLYQTAGVTAGFTWNAASVAP